MLCLFCRQRKAFDHRICDDHQLPMRWFDRDRMSAVTEGVFVFSDLSARIYRQFECETALTGTIIRREPSVVL
jgi:hypothetical protein